jgi:FdrA protein
VLGHGSHPDPAGELAPAIEAAIKSTTKDGRRLEVVAVVVGTDEDPQDMQSQIEQLESAGAKVFTVNAEAARYVGQLVGGLSKPSVESEAHPVELAVLNDPLSAINVGLESFAQSLTDQEAAVVHVDWRPPAGGNEQLMSILERMKSK